VVITSAVGHRGTKSEPDLPGQNAQQQEKPMYTRLPRPGTHPRTAALLRRLGALLAGTGALLALAAASPALAATVSVPHYGTSVPPAQVPAQIHTVTVGGMPGWQITLIAVGAAVLAALLAVTADRVRAAQPRHRLIRWATAPFRALRYLDQELLAAGGAIARSNRFPPPRPQADPAEAKHAQPAPVSKVLTKA
jgi:hypothetical protein